MKTGMSQGFQIKHWHPVLLYTVWCITVQEHYYTQRLPSQLHKIWDSPTTRKPGVYITIWVPECVCIQFTNSTPSYQAHLHQHNIWCSDLTIISFLVCLLAPFGHYACLVEISLTSPKCFFWQISTHPQELHLALGTCSINKSRIRDTRTV